MFIDSLGNIPKIFDKIPRATWRYWHANRKKNGLIETGDLRVLPLPARVYSEMIYDSAKMAQWLLDNYDNNNTKRAKWGIKYHYTKEELEKIKCLKS